MANSGFQAYATTHRAITITYELLQLIINGLVECMKRQPPFYDDDHAITAQRACKFRVSVIDLVRPHPDVAASIRGSGKQTDCALSGN